ncbi:hexokinase [Sporothrix brasiliensis 5110]|uniref:Phosphotransferase n=1 Tax=Sporothrix brasiliensis 5110 TaxID=1398154 RepID=A0A0C2IPY1_9PEZI|nr:hexokinase [Sporothrix brasiliensis 5110]KIH91081.1 hexokinase [Sporothrix brasiliensis 5110]
MTSPGASSDPSHKASCVDDIVASFAFSSDDVRVTADYLLQQLKSGLRDDRLPFQHPSFVTAIPDGSEKGRFLSVDLGGTNCRISLVDLHGDGTFSVEQQKHTVPHHVRVNARHEPLFDWVATQIGEFLRARQALGPDATQKEALSLGFTFSFTCTQTSLAAGTLLHWDKGWDIPSALGRDPCAMLQAATDAQRLPVRVAALANDSVGSLLTRAYTSSGPGATTLTCVIVGTGTNAAYVEKRQNVQRTVNHGADHRADHRAAQTGVVAMNTEWGCMDDGMRVLPRTRFDDMVDAQSTDGGLQMLEKRVSGMYLGELLRLAAVELYGKGVFDLRVPDADAPLFQKESIDASLLSGLASLEGDDDACMATAIQLLASTLGAAGVSAADVCIFQRLSTAIVTRAARLIGAATGAIVLQSGLLSTDGAILEEKRGEKQIMTIAVHGTATTVPTSAPKRSLSSIFGKARRILLAPFALCFGRHLKAETKPAVSLLQPPSPSPSTSPSPSVLPSVLPSSLPMIDIGMTGSVIEFHPTFEKDMRVALRQVSGIGPAGDARIRTGFCRDGSVVGAALMVHAAVKQESTAETLGQRPRPVKHNASN